MTKPRGKPVSRPARTQEAAPEASTRTAVPFAEILRRQQREAGKRRKGERTRDRLKLAAVQVLEERGFLNLRVTDICKRAKVSPAAFYLYFNNKQEVTVEVLTEFLHQTFKLAGSEGSARPLFESIYDANLIWASSVRANAGLMRCLLQLGDQVPEFKRLNSRLNHEWFVYVTDRLLRRFPKTRIDDKSLLLAVYALGGMMDELSSKVLVAREEHLQPVIEAVAPTDEALAEFLSVLWYRALFGSEPTRLRYPSSRELLKLSDIDRPEK